MNHLEDNQTISFTDGALQHQAPARFTVSKLFDDLPCCHRTWRHEGRCAYLHGYERRFEVRFSCEELDPKTGFVVDFASLKSIRHILEEQFNHTVLIAQDDPEREIFEELSRRGVCDLRLMPNTSMEGSATWVWDVVGPEIERLTSSRVHVVAVEARESRKNAVTLTER